MTPEDILTKAADIIATEGHTKNGRYYQADEGYCALGAMAQATGHMRSVGGYRDVWSTFWVDQNCMDAARRLAKTVGLDEYDNVPQWNDGEASAEDVILALKKAAHDA